MRNCSAHTDGKYVVLPVDWDTYKLIWDSLPKSQRNRDLDSPLAKLKWMLFDFNGIHITPSLHAANERYMEIFHESCESVGLHSVFDPEMFGDNEDFMRLTGNASKVKGGVN